MFALLAVALAADPCVASLDDAVRSTHRPGVRLLGHAAPSAARQLKAGSTQRLDDVELPDPGYYAPFVADALLEDEPVVVPAAADGRAFALDPATPFVVGATGAHNAAVVRARAGVSGPLVTAWVDDLDGDGKPDGIAVFDPPSGPIYVVAWGHGDLSRWSTELVGEAIPLAAPPGLYRLGDTLLTRGGCCGEVHLTLVGDGRSWQGRFGDEDPLCLTASGQVRVAPAAASRAP